MKLATLIELPFYEENHGDLVVAEGENIPFNINRVFSVRQKKGDIRGNHAHRLCKQLLICSNGALEIKCNDSEIYETHILDKPSLGLLIPPGIWADQRYLQDNTILTVLCDRLFEEDDYIRSYKDFIFFKKNS